MHIEPYARGVEYPSKYVMNEVDQARINPNTAEYVFHGDTL